MRKFLLIAIVALCTAFTAGAQNTYIAPSVNFSQNTPSYSFEIGRSYDKAQVGANYTYTPTGKLSNAGVSFQYKVTAQKNLSLWTYSNVSASLNRGHELSLTPGLSLCYFTNSSLVPQLVAWKSFSESGATAYGCSLSLNYNFR